MNHDHLSRLPLASISDLLAAVPYLLGFHAADSIVIVGLTGRRITVAGRGDLPQPATVTDWAPLAARQHLALWTDITRRAAPAPAPAAAPATLLALTAWRQGQGALASVALDRALAADPHYRLAHLIDHALFHGIPPTALDGWPTPGNPAP